MIDTETPYRGPAPSRGARDLLRRIGDQATKGKPPSGDGRHFMALENLGMIIPVSPDIDPDYPYHITNRGAEYLGLP